MSVTTMTFKCDRCPTEVSSGPPMMMVPQGWANLILSGPDMMLNTLHFCPECSTAFETYIGGDFKLRPPPPPPPPPIEPASAPAGD